MKNILLILGHPDNESYCAALAEAYKEGATREGANIKYVRLADLEFDPILHWGYNKRMDLEPDLVKTQEDIKWADHIVIVYPTWWGNMPALLKGFLDRILLPGFAYKYRTKNSLLWDKLLKGRSARLIITSSSNPWLFWLFFGYAGHLAMKKVTLWFCGIKPVKVSWFGPVLKVSDLKRKQWIEKVRTLGAKMK